MTRVRPLLYITIFLALWVFLTARLARAQSCMPRPLLHEVLQLTGARPTHIGQTPAGPVIIFATLDDRFFVIGYPSSNPAIACFLADGDQWTPLPQPETKPEDPPA